MYTLHVCLGVCLFVFNKRQNAQTDRAQIFSQTSRGPREGLWMIEFSKNFEILKIFEMLFVFVLQRI